MAIEIVGHAITSEDGKIADSARQMPTGLRVDADWRRFQAALDAAVLVVVGRLGHRAHPNPGRKRLVLTSSVAWLERDSEDDNAMLWNPDGISFSRVLTGLGIEDGTIAVTGGQRVFDYFLPAFTRFEHVEVDGVRLPDGIACFSTGVPAVVLAEAGLAPVTRATLAPGVQLTEWRR